MKNWSDYQVAIFNAVENVHLDGRDLVVMARAGTGKTTTVTEAVIRYCRLNPTRKVLTCAFNVKNAKELQTRLNEAGLDWRSASAKTLNSVGYTTIKKAWGKNVGVDAKKGRNSAKRACEIRLNLANQIDAPEGKVQKLATLAKITLSEPGNFEQMSELCRAYAVSGEEEEVAPLCALASDAMLISADDKSKVDFDDQLWFPHWFELTPWQHDLVVVDEAQDMNPSQLELARKSVKRNGRLVAVGDDRQAIYGWRAADSGFLARMVKELGAKTLLLPRTYRCGTSIVAEAKRLVPDYEADVSNPAGIVRDLPAAKLLNEVRRGDFVLCRANAPLLPICLELLRNRIPASIQGRDVMGQILGMVEKSKTETTDELLNWLDGHEERELAKLYKQDADQSLIDALSDRCACLRALAPDAETTAELKERLDELFSDVDDSSRVTLSTAHRAKGLERDRVFLLRDTFREGGQESNCLYVAITRARTELVYLR
jgi:superfamily I DNA/RNA helicase